MPFEKGNKIGKLGGRPRLSKEEKAMRLANRKEFNDLVNKYMSWTLEELQAQIRNCKGLTALDHAVINQVILMMETGSLERTDWVVDHAVGSKPKESTININAGQTLDLRTLSPEKLALVKQLINDGEDKK